jgi:microcompartment protein CcmK/EutM
LESIEEQEMKRAFDKIAAGLDDAITYAKGDTSRGRADSAADDFAEKLLALEGSVRRDIDLES